MANSRALNDYHVVYEREMNVDFNCGMDILRVVLRDPSDGCAGCFFAGGNKKCAISNSAREYVGRCERNLRTDGTDVKFIKVGEQEYNEE